MHKIQNGVGTLQIDDQGKELEIFLKPGLEIDKLHGQYKLGPFTIKLYPDGAHIIPPSVLK